MQLYSFSELELIRNRESLRNRKQHAGILLNVPWHSGLRVLKCGSSTRAGSGVDVVLELVLEWVDVVLELALDWM